MQSHAHSSSAPMTTTASSTTTTYTSETEQHSVSHMPASDTDIAMEDAPDAEDSVVEAVKAEQEQEDEQEQQQDTEGTEEQPEPMAVEELSIKQEVMEEDVQETSPFQGTVMVEVKVEKEEAEVVIKQEKDTSSSTITIKQEKDEETVTVKQEKIDAQSPSDDVKKEDSPVPIAQRRQMWEARSSAPSQQRSGLPLSKARINNQLTNAATRR